jgi:hypothetical protein
VGATWEANKLGGLNITECLQPRKSFPRKVASWTKAGSRPNLPRGRPMTSGKLTGACTRWDRRGRGPGNQGKSRRITSRRSRWQQGLVATCKDSSSEVKNRSRGEPHGIGTCARRSDDRRVTSPQEAGYVSLTKVTPTSGKGALGAWWFLRQARARLDKTGHHQTVARARDEAVSKPNGHGVDAN